MRHAKGVNGPLVRWLESDEIRCKCSASVLGLEI